MGTPRIVLAMVATMTVAGVAVGPEVAQAVPTTSCRVAIDPARPTYRNLAVHRVTCRQGLMVAQRFERVAAGEDVADANYTTFRGLGLKWTCRIYFKTTSAVAISNVMVFRCRTGVRLVRFIGGSDD